MSMKAKMIVAIYLWFVRVSKRVNRILRVMVYEVIKAKRLEIDRVNKKEEVNQDEYQLAINKVANKHNRISIENITKTQLIQKNIEELQDLL